MALVAAMTSQPATGFRAASSEMIHAHGSQHVASKMCPSSLEKWENEGLIYPYSEGLFSETVSAASSNSVNHEPPSRSAARISPQRSISAGTTLHGV